MNGGSAHRTKFVCEQRKKRFPPGIVSLSLLLYLYLFLNDAIAYITLDLKSPIGHRSLVLRFYLPLLRARPLAELYLTIAPGPWESATVLVQRRLGFRHSSFSPRSRDPRSFPSFSSPFSSVLPAGTEAPCFSSYFVFFGRGFWFGVSSIWMTQKKPTML